MGYFALGKSNDPTNYYEKVPESHRRLLENTLVGIRDKESAAESLSSKTGNRTDPKKFPGLLSVLLPGVASGGFRDEKGNKTMPISWLDNYDLVRVNPVNDLDIHVATDRKNEDFLSYFLNMFDVPYVNGESAFCDIPLCHFKVKSTKIPLTKAENVFPDEDGYCLEEIIPELVVYQMSNQRIFQQFINAFYDRSDGKKPNWWYIINTCQAHNNEEVLKKYIENETIWSSRKFITSLPSEIIFPQQDFSPHKRISIEFPI